MIKETFESFLNENNISYEYVESDIIAFSYKELNFIFAIDTTDDNYVRIILPKTTEFKDKAKYTTDILITLNSNLKVVKFEIIDNSVWISAEAFVFSVENIAILYQKLIDILVFAIDELYKKLTKI